jgi:hypothetical protein
MMLAACAETETPDRLRDKIQQATAHAVGGGVRMEDVVIVNFERKPATASWHAVVGNVVYACTSDERLNLPDCVKQA